VGWKIKKAISNRGGNEPNEGGRGWKIAVDGRGRELVKGVAVRIHGGAELVKENDWVARKVGESKQWWPGKKGEAGGEHR